MSCSNWVLQFYLKTKKHKKKKKKKKTHLLDEIHLKPPSKFQVLCFVITMEHLYYHYAYTSVQ